MGTNALQVEVGGVKKYCIPYFHVGYIMEETTGNNPSKYYGGTWELYGKGCVTACIDTSDSSTNDERRSISFNRSIGTVVGRNNDELIALIGATHSDTSRIGYSATGRVPNTTYGYDYSYSLVGNHVVASVPHGTVNHGTRVLTSNGYFPTNVQRSIIVYRWRKIAD